MTMVVCPEREPVAKHSPMRVDSRLIMAWRLHTTNSNCTALLFQAKSAARRMWSSVQVNAFCAAESQWAYKTSKQHLQPSITRKARGWERSFSGYYLGWIRGCISFGKSCGANPPKVVRKQDFVFSTHFA